MRRLVTDQQIESAIHNPPTDTRAYFRGRSLEKFRPQVKSIQWDNVTFNIKGRKTISVSMNQLADAEMAEKYNRILDQAQTVEALVKSLELSK